MSFLVDGFVHLDSLADAAAIEKLRIAQRSIGVGRWCFVFNHFFFPGGELERAAELLERRPNVHLDLTPGIEMYFAFSRNRGLAHRFFSKYSRRILLGSYSSPGRPPGPLVGMIRRFLETQDSFDPPHGDPFMGPESRGPLLGLALEHRPLNDIYWNNWRRIAGKRPARLDGPHVSAYLEHWMGLDSGPDLAGQVSALYSSRQAER